MLYRLKDAWGNWRYLEGTADLMGEEHILMVSRDVSMRIKTEQDLEKERKELEGKVEERTKELKMKTERLEETNTALKVLLEMRERDRKELEQSVLFNVSQLAGPYLEKLKKSGLDEKQKGYLNILGSSLEEIVLPLSRDLVVSETNLTPSEVRIANLIKLGKSSKEIAESLNLSIKTIETHRRNIRTKLGIEKKKTNLRSYLLNRPNP
jgi:DNA-binding CsgD family transcriptional regulator